MKTRNGLFADVPEELWNDWHWQVEHRLSTVEEIAQVINLSEQEKADIVVFGHTHQQLTVLESNMILVNPGSVGYAGQYSTIEIDENTGSVTVKEFPHNKYGAFVVK